MTPQDKIRRFFSYFRSQVTLIDSLAGDPTIHGDSSDPAARYALHKKILLSAILDCLAGVRYREEPLRNKDKFQRILREHCDWPEGNLVSVPILAESLTGHSNLKEEVSSRLADYPAIIGNSLPLTAFDITLSRALELAAGEEEKEKVKRSTHYSLFYRHRNFTVHEFREPGYAMETFADGGEEPLYHAYLGKEQWRLLYPVGFFRLRAERAIGSLEAYFEQENLDPYTLVSDSSAW